jgi:hypothetical protein
LDANLGANVWVNNNKPVKLVLGVHAKLLHYPTSIVSNMNMKYGMVATQAGVKSGVLLAQKRNF